MAGFADADAQVAPQVDQTRWGPQQRCPSHETVPVVGPEVGSVNVACVKNGWGPCRWAGQRPLRWGLLWVVLFWFGWGLRRLVRVVGRRLWVVRV